MTDAPYQPKIVKALPDKFTLTITRGEHLIHIHTDAHEGFRLVARDEAELPEILASCPEILLMLLDLQARHQAGEDLRQSADPAAAP